jgi:SHS2 domain-containing protein
VAARDAESVPPAGHREFDYSGDIGIEAWGATRAELMANATRGLLGLMTWSRVDPVVERRIDVRSTGPAELLVDWLSEVILAAAARGEVYGEVTMTGADETSASGFLRGGAYDPARHELRFDVKAATYHDLLVETTPAGFHARVVFDL